MNEKIEQVDHETLARHMGWIRALARQLVMDDNEADDAVQEVWLAALEKRPATPDLRSWLRSALRYVLLCRRRSDSNRRRREQCVARPLSTDVDDGGPSQLVQHRLVKHVLSLPRHYRAVVLLRYYRGMATRDIASRLDLPSETVRTRLKRAHERLRTRLGADDSSVRTGDCWRQLLLPLAAGEPSVPTATAPVALKLAVALTCLCGLAGGALWLKSRPVDTEPVSTPSTTNKTSAAASATPVPRAATPDESVAVPARAADPRPAIAENQRVSGFVRDVAGRPLAGASVRALEIYVETRLGVGARCIAEPRVLALTSSSSDGSYVLGPVKGEFILEAAAAAQARSRRMSRAGATEDFMLGAGHKLTGVVTGRDNAVCGGATVTVTRKGTLLRSQSVWFNGRRASWRSHHTFAETRTRANGAYEIPDLPEGDYGIAVYPPIGPAFVVHEFDIGIASGAVVRDVMLPPICTVTVEGYVVDDVASQPVAGAEVMVATNSRHRVRTDRRGRFRLTDVEVGVAWLVAMRDGYQENRTRVAVTAPGVAVTVLRLSPRSNDAGESVGGVEGWLTMERPHEGVASLHDVARGVAPGVVRDDRHVPVDAAGRFSFADVPPGRYHLTLWCRRQFHVFDDVITVRTGSIARPRLRVPACTIRGRVTGPGGRPVAGAQVFYRRQRQPLRAGYAITGADGAFVLSGLNKYAIYDLSARSLQFMRATVPGVKPFTTGLVLRLGQRPPVRVRVAGTGPFFVRAHPRLKGANARPLVYNFSGATRLVTLGNAYVPFAAGDYDVEAGDAEGRVSQLVGPITCTAGHRPLPLDLRLGPGSSVCGRVTRKDGTAAAHATVHLTHLTRSGAPSARSTRVRTDHEGGYRVGWLQPGSYRLRVEDATGVVVTPPFLVKNGETHRRDLTVARSGSVAVVVVDAAGRPAIGAVVSLLAIGDQRPPLPLDRNPSLMTNERGEARLRGIATGPYDVWVTHREGLTARSRLKVMADQETRLSVTLAVGSQVRLVAVDEGGRGVGGARVEILDSNGHSIEMTTAEMHAWFGAATHLFPTLSFDLFLAAIRHTNPQGAFESTALPPGAYRFRVSHPRYQPVEERVVLAGLTRSVRVVLPPGKRQ